MMPRLIQDVQSYVVLLFVQTYVVLLCQTAECCQATFTYNCIHPVIIMKLLLCVALMWYLSSLFWINLRKRKVVFRPKCLLEA